MNYSTYSFTLDLHETQAQVSLPVKFGDTGRKLYITLTDGGSPYLLKEGSRAVLSAKKANDDILFNNCIIDTINMAIMYTFTEHTADCEGMTQCEILIYGSNGEVVGSPRFIMIVDKRVNSDDAIVSQEERTELDMLLFKLDVAGDAEAARVTAENSRVEAEGIRESAETSRVSAEEDRVAAEELRVEAEKTRTTFIPSVSEDGVLSWTNDKGLENPAPLPLIQSLLNKIPQAEGGLF